MQHIFSESARTHGRKPICDISLLPSSCTIRGHATVKENFAWGWCWRDPQESPAHPKDIQGYGQWLWIRRPSTAVDTTGHEWRSKVGKGWSFGSWIQRSCETGWSGVRTRAESKWNCQLLPTLCQSRSRLRGQVVNARLTTSKVHELK